MYFECNEGVIAEDGSRLKHKFHDLNDGTGLRTRTNVKSPQQGDNAKILASVRTWYSIVRAFGVRDLSRPTDKLPARTWTFSGYFLPCPIFHHLFSSSFAYMPMVSTDLTENDSKRYCQPLSGPNQI